MGWLERFPKMGKWKKVNRRKWAGRERESLLAKVSVLLLLSNGFLWAGLRSLDILLLTLLSALVGLAGLIFGILARRHLRRHHGRIGGESLALIGYWGNLAMFILPALMFSYAFAMGVLRGELL